jgi:hypothetical protein
MCISGVICTLLSSCCNPILYKPSADPSSALLKVTFPKVIETLSGFSGGETKVKKGPDEPKKLGELKEIIEIFKGEPGELYFGTEYRFYLYYTEDKAKIDFLNQRSYTKNSFHNIFVAGQSENSLYFVSYVEQPRSDPGGLCMPMDYYVQNALFCFGNLIIDVKTRDRKFSRDMLTKPIVSISQLLDEYFKKGTYFSGIISKERPQTAPPIRR